MGSIRVKRIFAVLIACILSCATTRACINTSDWQVRAQVQKPVAKELVVIIARLESELRKSPTVEVTNDLAVAHVLAGHYDIAIKLLRGLEAEHPGYGKTASNLGTALELSGSNDEALDWIKAGIERDPNDHEGTEWLHVKILVAKIWLDRDPTWLEKHSVLGVDFGRSARPKPDSDIKDHLGKSRSMDEAVIALRYQLQERLKLVSRPDPLISDLFFTWANIEALPKEHDAFDYYQTALQFSGAKQALINLRTAQFKEDHPDPSDGHRYGLWITVFLVLAFFKRGAIWVDRKFRDARQSLSNDKR
jgi:tetratricopeptide (TPR) repeat protein